MIGKSSISKSLSVKGFDDDMSLDKSISSGKEHRKPYRGSKSVDKTCRNNGGCPWCEGNRLCSTYRELLRIENEMKEFEIEAKKSHD